MSLKDIREYIQLAMEGDSTIDQRLDLFLNQRKVLLEQMAELQQTLDTLDYKCWYYETAKAAGTIQAPQQMTLDEIPEKFRPVIKRLHESSYKRLILFPKFYFSGNSFPKIARPEVLPQTTARKMPWGNLYRGFQPNGQDLFV